MMKTNIYLQNFEFKVLRKTNHRRILWRVACQASFEPHSPTPLSPLLVRAWTTSIDLAVKSGFYSVALKPNGSELLLFKYQPESNNRPFVLVFGIGRFVEFDDEVLSKFSEFSSVEWHGWSWSRPPFSSATFVVEVEDSFITMSASVWLRVFVLESHCIKLVRSFFRGLP